MARGEADGAGETSATEISHGEKSGRTSEVEIPQNVKTS